MTKLANSTLSHGARVQEGIVASAKYTGAQIARNVAAKDLANRSDLFEHGEITAAQDEQSFILRLKAMGQARRSCALSRAL